MDPEELLEKLDKLPPGSPEWEKVLEHFRHAGGVDWDQELADMAKQSRELSESIIMHCSFCGREGKDVPLLRGDHVSICDECSHSANQTLSRRRQQLGLPPLSASHIDSRSISEDAVDLAFRVRQAVDYVQIKALVIVAEDPGEGRRE